MPANNLIELRAIKALTGMLFLFLVMFMAFNVSGQNLDKKISINLKNVTLAEAIKQIGEAGNVFFSYSPQSIPVNNIVSVKAKNKAVKEVLNDLFKKNGIEYSVIENQIILKSEKIHEPDKHANKTPEVARYTISGILKEKGSGEVLIGAYAYAKGTSLGTTTNAYGFYSLSLPAGNYSLVFSFIGYQPIIMDIDLNKSQVISLELDAVKTEIKPVEIIAKDAEEALKKGQFNISKLQPKLLEQLPGVAGDIDIIKSLQAVPGIKSFGDGSAMFYTRGGQSDQNLILVDEAPIYNPAHLFGFVSALAPEAIKDMTVFKGDAPANYGGRLSSVIDIKTRDGNMKRFGFAGNLGVFVSDLAFEGPFKRDKASWLITGRISNLNWLFSNRTNLRQVKMNFYDLNAKFNFKLNNNNRLFFTFYYGNDAFSRENSVTQKTFGITWNNLLGTIRWNHIFNNKLFSNTTVYYSRYNYYLFSSRESNDYWKSSISNIAVKTDFTYYINPNNTFKTGFDISPHQSDPGNIYFSDPKIAVNTKTISKYQSVEYAIYACNEQQVGKRFNFKYGIRLTLWQNYGPGTYYVFNDEFITSDTLSPAKNKDYASFIRPEPRLIATYMPGKSNALRFCYSRTNQFVQVLNNSTSPFTSLESWVPSGPNFKPQSADLFTLGYSHRLPKQNLLFSAEIYYKQSHNALDYIDHSNILFNPLLENELRVGKAWSYGIELMVRKETGKISGWIAYTYSRALRKTAGINNGKTYPASYDTPHEICVNFTYDTYKRWSFVLNWIYHTGSPVTSPIGFYYYEGASVPIYGDKNNDRLPDYHRLDLSIIFKISKPERKYQHSLSLNIFNVYARKNPFSLNFNKFIDENNNFIVPADMSGNYDRVPTFISASGIIPSLNYKFRF
jgi:hypothetical protein